MAQTEDRYRAALRILESKNEYELDRYRSFTPKLAHHMTAISLFGALLAIVAQTALAGDGPVKSLLTQLSTCFDPISLLLLLLILISIGGSLVFFVGAVLIVLGGFRPVNLQFPDNEAVNKLIDLGLVTGYQQLVDDLTSSIAHNQKEINNRYSAIVDSACWVRWFVYSSVASLVLLVIAVTAVTTAT